MTSKCSIKSRAIVQRSSVELNQERISRRKKRGDEMLEAVRAIRDALLSPRVRSLPGDDSPFVLKCGELYDYSRKLCSRCMKRHVGGVFCFLTPHEDLMLDVFRLGVRTARIPEVEAEAKMRSG